MVLSSEIRSSDTLWYHLIYAENTHKIHADHFLTKTIDLNLYLDETKCNDYVNQLT